jgi:hypothetical protein
MTHVVHPRIGAGADVWHPAESGRDVTENIDWFNFRRLHRGSGRPTGAIYSPLGDERSAYEER